MSGFLSSFREEDRTLFDARWRVYDARKNRREQRANGGAVFKIPARYLLLIAAAVWFLAGVNIVRLGVLAAAEGQPPLLLVLGIPAAFLAFHPMFSKLVGKHADRIRGYGEDRMHVLRFFDVKGYVIMAIMMGGGIGLRAAGLVPSWFVAFFYTGLGCALALAGIGFLVHYVHRGGTITCPVTKRTRLA